MTDDDLTEEEILDFLCLVAQECDEKKVNISIYASFLKECADEMRSLRRQIEEYRRLIDQKLANPED